MPTRTLRGAPPSVKQHDVDMTEGSITRHILNFALPLLPGNLFQQLYTTVDAWVVGNFVSNAAYSAVGATGPIVNTLIGFFSGLSAGTGVVISQYYGAGRHDKVQDTVHTAVLMTVILSLVFNVVGVSFIPLMLKFTKMPASVVPEATTYLQIYFCGVNGLMLYNIGAGILRAVGDSRRPFYFLVVCALVNTALDLIFILVFNMGVAGVALATVISQGVSAFLVLAAMMKSRSCIHLSLRKLRIHWQLLRKIVLIGIPAGLQMAVTAFSNIFVQSYINFFGEDAMAGWTTYSKVDQLLFLPMQSIALATTTFVGQNLGKGQPKRANDGVKCSLALSLGATAILLLPIMIFSSSLVAFFNSKPEAVYHGTLFLHWLSPFYLVCCSSQIYTGALRGSGNSQAPMVIMLGSYVLFRQVYLFAMSHICNRILPIAMAYPGGWIVCSIIMTVYYRRVRFRNQSVI